MQHAARVFETTGQWTIIMCVRAYALKIERKQTSAAPWQHQQKTLNLKQVWTHDDKFSIISIFFYVFWKKDSVLNKFLKIINLNFTN